MTSVPPTEDPSNDPPDNVVQFPGRYQRKPEEQVVHLLTITNAQSFCDDAPEDLRVTSQLWDVRDAKGECLYAYVEEEWPDGQVYTIYEPGCAILPQMLAIRLVWEITRHQLDPKTIVTVMPEGWSYLVNLAGLGDVVKALKTPS